MTNPEKRIQIGPHGIIARKIWWLAMYLVFGGLVPLLAGEIWASDLLSRIGIWSMVAGIGLGFVAKGVSYIELMRDLSKPQAQLPPNEAFEQTREK